MSTPFLVRLAFRAGVAACVFAACSDAPRVDARVSYDGLDTPNHANPFEIGILCDGTGSGPAGGREFADAWVRRFGAESARSGGLDLRVHVLDDRGTDAGIRGGAERMRRDPGVHLGIIEPGAQRAAIVGELAPALVVVCVGCARDDALREGTFAFTSTGGSDTAIAAAEWVVEALVRAREPNSRAIAEALRSTRAPAGYACFEGAAPAPDPFAFRRPSQAIKK